MATSTPARGGITFAGLLAILFIALRLTDKIGWSWVWVLSPLWIPLAFWGAIVVLCLIMALITGQVPRRRRG